MGKFIVEGNKKLSGIITVAGNKNEALPLIAASLLTSKSVTFNNVPDIGDVRTMVAIAEQLGVKAVWMGNSSLSLHAATVTTSSLPVEISNKIRASILFASALLVRTGNAAIIQPGGDTIGRRRLDTHFLVFKALGATLSIERTDTQTTSYILSAPHGLHGTDIYLDEASVTATENAIIAAAGAHGVTRINNAASEPHVQGLCRFLEKLGVKFNGIGSNIITIENEGIISDSVEIAVSPDYIEAGSFIGMAAATRSSLSIAGVDPRQMRMIFLQFERIGVVVEYDSSSGLLYVSDKQPLTIRRDFGAAIPRIEDSPWPGFPSDLMSILLVTATQSSGTCLIHEKMYESRLYFVDKLIIMGAQIVLCDPHRAVIVGSSPLFGASINSPDIRAGMALLIAAMAAEGKSVINNITQIDRGYEKIDQRLRVLGASIERSDDCGD